MNREIKFRAIIKGKNATIYFTLQTLLENKFSNRVLLIPWLKAGNQPDEYIGLKDKNGKEIYSGDIVFDLWRNKAIVKWGQYDACGAHEHEPYCWMRDNSPLEDGENLEVIGNVWENKELFNDSK